MDELSSRARALLEAAHDVDDPIPSDAMRVRRGVLLRIGSAGFGATVFSLSLQRASAFLGAAAPKVAAVLVMAVGGSAVYHRTQREPAPVVTVLARAAQPQRKLAPAAPAPTEAPAVALAPPLSVVDAPPALVSHRSRARAKLLQPAGSPPATSSELEGEMRWVRSADAALRAGNSVIAQSLLDQHAREFPNGALSEEREGLRVVAACQGTPSGDAKRAAARFLERAPHSLLAGRLRAACPKSE